MFRYHSEGNPEVAKELAEDIFATEMSRIVFTGKSDKAVSVAYIFDLPMFVEIINDPTTADALQAKITKDIERVLGKNFNVLPTDVDRIGKKATIIANKIFTKGVAKPKKK